MSSPVKESRNAKVLASFMAYCKANPEQRFWQALLNWSGALFIFAELGGGIENMGGLRDTFNWEERDK